MSQKSVAHKILKTLLGDQIFGPKSPKVVQSGPNWPKMALCPSGPSKPGWPKHVQKFSLPTSFSKLCWQHNTNRDFDFPDDEPASTNSKLPKTTDAVDNMERTTGMDSWTLVFRKDSFGIVVRKT